MSHRSTLDSGVCHIAYFEDPDGNALMLHHRATPRHLKPDSRTAPGARAVARRRYRGYGGRNQPGRLK